MSLIPYSLTRSFLFGMDPEAAHDLTMDMLAKGQRTPLQWAWCQTRVDDPVELAGLRFPNRVGMAAGLDKNARCIDALGAMGFGFVEVGTVTPKPQPGNPKPRMFRLPEARALINRLGFNNEGLDAFIHNVQRAQFRKQHRASPHVAGAEHWQERQHAHRKCHQRLSCVPGWRIPACRLRDRQHQLAQHAKPAGSAKRRSTGCFVGSHRRAA